jgi:hypothetical protein
MPQTYVKPVVPNDLVTLTSVDLKATELTPKTAVICINRGREVYRDKCDGRDYEVPPGHFEVAYEVAAHFRERSVVPGSRNPITGRQTNFIAILGMDKPEDCVPFDDDASERQSEAPEALDRSDMALSDRQVTVVPTRVARARTAGRGRGREASLEQNDSTEPAPDAAEPPIGGDAALASRGGTFE